MDELEGVRLYGKFPVRLVPYKGGIEVLSGCDEVKRSAYVRPKATQYVITTYKNDGSDIDGTPVEGHFSKSAALKAAQEFVATGNKKVNNERRRNGRIRG